MRKRIPLIFDCDNTMGVPGCDLDDGLTLLYLLGCAGAELLGITCAYGNSDQETVYRNTVSLLEKWGRTDIPVYRGCEDPGFLRAYKETGKTPDHRVSRRSEAAAFLAKTAKEYDGELCVLATGSMSNLAGAEEEDPDFFGHLRAVSVMGGVTGALLVGGLPMDELNLSCDPYASHRVLFACSDLRIASAQNSLQSFFDRKGFHEYMKRRGGDIAEMLLRETAYWFDLNEREWNTSGAVIWDVMAAVQLLHPESLEMKEAVITADTASLCDGSLYGNGEPVRALLPEIGDPERYLRDVYGHLLRADIRLPASEQISGPAGL